MDFYLRPCLEKLYAQKTNADVTDFLFYLSREHGRILCLYESGRQKEAEVRSEDLRRKVQLTADESAAMPENTSLSDLVGRIQARVSDINKRSRGRNKLRFGIAVV